MRRKIRHAVGGLVGYVLGGLAGLYLAYNVSFCLAWPSPTIFFCVVLGSWLGVGPQAPQRWLLAANGVVMIALGWLMDYGTLHRPSRIVLLVGMGFVLLATAAVGAAARIRQRDEEGPPFTQLFPPGNGTGRD